MDFKIYPQPVGDHCTPFIYDIQQRTYSRYYYNGSSFNLIAVSLSYDNNKPQVNVNGISKEILVGKKEPNKDKIFDYLKHNKGVSSCFLSYIRNTVVIPTYSITPEEAVIRIIIRQLINAKSAKKLFSNFVKIFGFQQDGIYGFPNPKQLEYVSLNDLNEIGLGFKSDRILSSIALINSQKSGEISRMSGIGVWSNSVLEVENNKTYSLYPFWDKSGLKIKEKIGIDLEQVSYCDRDLSGDLYIYAISYLENVK